MRKLLQGYHNVFVCKKKSTLLSFLYLFIYLFIYFWNARETEAGSSNPDTAKA